MLTGINYIDLSLKEQVKMFGAEIHVTLNWVVTVNAEATANRGVEGFRVAFEQLGGSHMVEIAVGESEAFVTTYEELCAELQRAVTEYAARMETEMEFEPADFWDADEIADDVARSWRAA